MKYVSNFLKYCLFKFFCITDKIVHIYFNKQYFPKLIFVYDYILYGLFLDFVRSHKPLFHSMLMCAVTYKCNCSCDMCGVDSYKQKDKEELSRSDILSLIRNCHKQGLRCIYFFGGEPFMSPYLVEYVAFAKKCDMYTQIDTNGYFLNEEKIKELKNAKIDFIRLSLDSLDMHTHDSLRGIKGIGEKVLNAVLLCKKYKIECGLSTMVTKVNLRNGEIERLIKYAKSMNISIRLLSSIQCGNWAQRSDVVLSGEDIEVLRTYLEKPLVYWEVPNVSQADARFFCSATNRKILYASPYGDVQPCCYVSVSFGNLHDESIDSIVTRMWQSDLMLTKDKKKREQYFYKDCIVNSPWFRECYARHIPDDGPHPYDYDAISSLRKQSENNRKDIADE